MFLPLLPNTIIISSAKGSILFIDSLIGYIFLTGSVAIQKRNTHLYDIKLYYINYLCIKQEGVLSNSSFLLYILLKGNPL